MQKMARSHTTREATLTQNGPSLASVGLVGGPETVLADANVSQRVRATIISLPMVATSGSLLGRQIYQYKISRCLLLWKCTLLLLASSSSMI